MARFYFTVFLFFPAKKIVIFFIDVHARLKKISEFDLFMRKFSTVNKRNFSLLTIAQKGTSIIHYESSSIVVAVGRVEAGS